MERKEAIEVVKKNWPDSSFTMLREALETLVPELKESEDEKIRVFLVDFIKVCKWTEKEDQGWPTKDACVAWLEKQGEQKPAEEYNITGIGSKNAQGKLGEMIKKLKPVNEILEQKHWSEEDERNLDWLMTVCERIHYKSDPQVAPDSALMLKDWLKSLKERYTWKPSDLPHWKKSTLPNDNTTGFNSDYFCYKGYNINYKELFKKLPKDD